MAPFRNLRRALGLRKDRPSRFVSVGRFTYGISERTVFNATAECPVSIGAFCSFADGVQVHANSNHVTEIASTFPLRLTLRGEAEPVARAGGVRICNDVWIGSRAILLTGITVGDGAVVGAGAVVTRDVEPYAIVAGNPARLIRHRFDAPTIVRLLKIAWWEWPEEKLRAELDSFYGPIDAFLARHDAQGS